MKWFMHDSNAHTDAKLRKVMMRFGADGYGLYWYCLELIAGNVDAGRYTFELEHDAEILAYDLKIDSLRVEEIMRYLVSLGLFENTDGRITCLKMASRLDTRFTRSPELQQVIKQAKTGNVLRPSEDCLSTVGAIVEYSIGEDKKEKRRRFTPPSPKEVTEYVATEQLCIDPIVFITHYQSVGWRVGKSQMKDWRAAARGWHQREEKRHASNQPGRSARADTSAAGRVRANVKRELDTLAAARAGGDGLAAHVQPVRTQVG